MIKSIIIAMLKAALVRLEPVQKARPVPELDHVNDPGEDLDDYEPRPTVIIRKPVTVIPEKRMNEIRAEIEERYKCKLCGVGIIGEDDARCGHCGFTGRLS